MIGRGTRRGGASARTLACSALLALVACAHEATLESSAILVFERPPPDREQSPPPAPSQDAVWAEGHWVWAGDDGYRWADGEWLTAREGQVYVQAHWERRGRGWIYVPGRFMPVGD